MNAGALISNAIYLIVIKASTNWYWEGNVNKDSVTTATRNIVHPCLDVATIKDVSDIPHSLCNKNSHKELFKGIQFVSLIKIMNTFQMKLIGKIKLSMKELLMR